MITISVHREDPRLVLKAYGNLVIQGWDRQEVGAQTSYQLFKMRQEGDEYTMTCQDNCILSVPAGSDLAIEKAAGNATIRDLTRELVIEKVGGNLNLLNVKSVTVEKVGGDFAYKNITGNLEIEKIGGNLSGEGDLNLLRVNKIGGDLTVRGIATELKAEVGGNITAEIKQLGEEGCELGAGGDISLFLPGVTGAEFTIDSGAEEIHLKLGDNKQYIEEGSYTYTLGEGGPHVRLRAGGNVAVHDEPFDEHLMDDFEDIVSANLERSISAEVERATRRAQVVAERAQRRVDAAMKRMESRRQGWHEAIPPIPPIPPINIPHFEFRTRPPTPPVTSPRREPVTDEERMLVLKMVADKQISVDEAERLLKAMEG
jgi:hypothetical protein